MKIKLLINYGSNMAGDIVDVAVDSSKKNAYFFDSQNLACFVNNGSFEIINQGNDKKQPEFYSVRDLLGQDIKLLEFK